MNFLPNRQICVHRQSARDQACRLVISVTPSVHGGQAPSRANASSNCDGSADPLPGDLAWEARWLLRAVSATRRANPSSRQPLNPLQLPAELDSQPLSALLPPGHPTKGMQCVCVCHGEGMRLGHLPREQAAQRCGSEYRPAFPHGALDPLPGWLTPLSAHRCLPRAWASEVALPPLRPLHPPALVPRTQGKAPLPPMT